MVPKFGKKKAVKVDWGAGAKKVHVFHSVIEKKIPSIGFCCFQWKLLMKSVNNFQENSDFSGLLSSWSDTATHLEGFYNTKKSELFILLDQQQNDEWEKFEIEVNELLFQSLAEQVGIKYYSKEYLKKVMSKTRTITLSSKKMTKKYICVSSHWSKLQFMRSGTLI